jgi:hypothetical protein
MFFIFAMSCDDLGKESPLLERPIQTTFKVEDFSSATQCQNCHPNYYEEWSTSMHAYSTQDPVWFKLQQNAHNSHAAEGVELGDFCVQCHSPIASLTDAIADHENLTPEVMSNLPLQIQEGVTCDVCHTITHLPETTDIQPTEQLFETVDFKMFTDGTRYGILNNPQENEFHSSEYHPGYDKSEFCQNCHNLSVDGIDAEVTQFEWEGSAFEAMGSECQTCHMPTYQGQAARGGPYRENLHRHYFPGIDAQLNSGSPDFELVSAIEDLLVKSAEIHFFEPLPDSIDGANPLNFNLIVSNNVGHKFPTGTTFTRQLWLEVVAILGNDTIMTSGLIDSNGDIVDFYVDPDRIIDPQLHVFNTVLYNAKGDSGLLNVGVEDMAWMSDYTLPVSGSRTVNYTVEFPAGQSGDLSITTRLRFRSFPPLYLRYLGLPTEAERLKIFDVDEVVANSIVR